MKSIYGVCTQWPVHPGMYGCTEVCNPLNGVLSWWARADGPLAKQKQRVIPAFRVVTH